MQRYDEWARLREVAIQNHAGSSAPLPTSLTAPLPPRPGPFEDEDVGDISADLLNQTGQFEGASESFNLERSMQEEHVPVADPGMEKPVVRRPCAVVRESRLIEYLFHSAP